AARFEVLSECSCRMAGAVEVEDLLPRMARILAEGTGAQEASVWLAVGSELRPEASWPAEAVLPESLALSDGRLPELPGALALPVPHRRALLGALTLTTPPGARLTPASKHLGGDLTAATGIVRRNAR